MIRDIVIEDPTISFRDNEESENRDLALYPEW